MKIKTVALLNAAILSCAACASNFEHSLSGTKPWTSEKFLDDAQEFHFAIVSDRTGGERKGYFPKAMDSLNLLRPEFVMSVGDLIAGGGVSEKDLRKQWDELEGYIAKLKMPFLSAIKKKQIA